MTILTYQTIYTMLPKPLKQTLKYNNLLMPKEHRQVNDNSNFELWNALMAINSNHPTDEITIDYIVKDFGHYYGIDMKLACDNPLVQKQLDDVYERNIKIPRFRKHNEFEAMLEID